MDFDRSTQAKSWMFSAESLEVCRQRALLTESAESKYTPSFMGRVRKFASGFHRRCQHVPATKASSSEVSIQDQETLIQFHAHQIQFLVGPTAILQDLRTSETVLFTAVTFFRRFYLSNSVVEVNPRRIAAACAFFAAKVEEQKIEISLLSHATELMQRRVQHSPLCRKELRAVQVLEIELAERLLMEGLNYEFRCFHSSSTIHDIFATVFALDGSVDSLESGVSFDRPSHNELIYARQKAMDVAQRALVFSDVPFLFSPYHTGFAIAAIVTGSVTKAGYMGIALQKYLIQYFPAIASEGVSFSQTVKAAIHSLLSCPALDLRPSKCAAKAIVTERAENFRRVLTEVATIRLLRKTKRGEDLYPSLSLKRMRIEQAFTPPRFIHERKYAKVTPTGER